MTRGIKGLVIIFILLGDASLGAQTATEPLSGLPLAPGLNRTGDAVQSYQYCKKSASVALYASMDFADMDHEVAWFTRAMPNAAVFTSLSGIKTFITPDGTAAVEAADAFISYFRFSPGLSPDEMKRLGAEPASRSCSSD